MKTQDLQTVRLHPGVDDGTLAALQQALVTMDPSELGVGADATDWPAEIPAAERYLQLAAAWRVQHPTMWRRYSTGPLPHR